MGEDSKHITSDEVVSSYIVAATSIYFMTSIRSGKHSKIIYRVLIGMVAAVTIISILSLEEQEIITNCFFLWIVVPIMGWLWFQSFSDSAKGN